MITLLVSSERFHFSFRGKEEYSLNHDDSLLETNSDDDNLVVDDQEEDCELKTSFNELIQEQNEDPNKGKDEELATPNPDIPVLPDTGTGCPKKRMTEKQGK